GFVTVYGNEFASAGWKGKVFIEAGDSYTSGLDGAISFLTGAGVERMTITYGGNIGINNNSPNAAALLHLVSTTQGFLPPVMTTTQKAAISSPPAGLVVYDATLNKLCVYTGAAWQTITSA
ncbi:MAG TPA: hypothetical protein VIN67_03025, partial [Desulfobaccales bacterium]